LRPLAPLIIDEHVAEVRDALARRRAVVLSASPGAGKTTRIPPALIDAGPLILLQPRRVAARAVARRIAEEREWTLGREVGWHIRLEKRATRDTRLLVVTEGILTARLQQDPLLSDFSTIVLDEFHERSVHLDLGLALARQAWLARTDVRLVVMSATLDVQPVARFLDDAPVVSVSGALHPLSIEYADRESIAEAARAVLSRTAGQVLCFLPGVREIERASSDISSFLSSGLASGVAVVPLHGSLDGDAQDAAISPSEGRRIILATNIAETSLTVPGVSAVIDTGQVKVARYDADRGVDSLTLERITSDSAEQRAGRAGRLGPGLVRRLWDARDRLRPHREPEIARVDLAGPVLDVLAWGADPLSFDWFEAPSTDRIRAALHLLCRLGAADGDDAGARITGVGRTLQRVPLHPRLARILIDARSAPEAAAACARLSLGATGATSATVRQVAHELQRVASAALGGDVAAHVDDDTLRHALFAGYPDRLAKRRPGSRDRFLLATGHGASLAREAAAVDAEFIVALDVVAAAREGVSESRIRAASEVDRGWIQPTRTGVELRFDPLSGRVRAARVEYYDAITLSETPVQADPVKASALLAEAWLAQPQDAATIQLVRRLKFAGVEIDLPEIAGAAAASVRNITEVDLEAHLPFAVKRALSDRAPASIALPSGRSTALDYGEDGSVSASVKLQELFGLAQSPTVGTAAVPVTFQLLAPNGRPVQTTKDLRSFWARTYPEVRKELRGRYPKHPWPEDPWTARPTHRTIRRR
jgi:ATP-dependent helicase HrpB